MSGNALLLSVLLATCCFLSSAQTMEQPTKQLKVMTYNIYNGFDYGKETAREQAAADWIALEQPDVVALQELCGFTEEKLKKFGGKWGHDYVVLLKEEGFPVGLTSNKPITVKKKMIDELWHGMLHVATHGIDFINVHLCPSDYPTRMKEMDIITAYMKETLSGGKDEYIILGDFNAHSPFDAFLDKQHPALSAKYLQLEEGNKVKNRQNLIHDTFDYGVISGFLAFPLIDVCERQAEGENRFSFPSPIHFSPSRERKEIAPIRERLDYIFASPNLADKCSLATIVNSEVTDSLSDHYPVIAEFALTKMEWLCQ